MSLDLSKYRNVFIEEATEHLSDMSGALLALEKDVSNAEAIDVVFRMAHGIKGMAASLEYDAITEVSHRMEDRMTAVRETGQVSAAEMTLLFRGLDALESMVSAVRETGDAPGLDAEPVSAFLAAADGVPAPDTTDARKKKALNP
ncbi:MAG: Hpt domain-containing protein [Myxococcota bacterium]